MKIVKFDHDYMIRIFLILIINIALISLGNLGYYLYHNLIFCLKCGEFNNNYGYINKQGHVILPMSKLLLLDNFKENVAYVHIIPGDILDIAKFAEGLRHWNWFCHDGWFINNCGFKVFDGFYARATGFKNGYSGVSLNDYSLWGFINLDGKVVIKPKYINVKCFNNGLAPVQDINTKYGFIDQKGCYKISPQYQNVSEFSDFLALVELNNKIGIINLNNKFIIPPIYDCASIGFEGIIITYDQKFRMIIYYDKYGRKMFKIKNINLENPLFKRIHLDFTNNFLCNKEMTRKFNNNILILFNFSNGLAVYNYESNFGYLNYRGIVKIQPKFEEAYPFNEGLALVKYKGKYGYINTSGDFVIKADFQDAQNFSEGLAVVRIDDKWGYIDKKGKLIIRNKFIFANSFHNGYAIVGYPDI